jgi:cupin fold WbuC family metalloprotein
MKQLPYADLDVVTRQAEASPRRRMNRNLHEDLADPIQRLAIAMEPDTYIRPHVHRSTWELLTALRGRFIVLQFDADGVVVDRAVLGEEASVIETPIGGCHAVLSCDPGAVIFEVKHGPYVPFSEKDFAPWSPAADTPAASDLLAWYAHAAIGQRWGG